MAVLAEGNEVVRPVLLRFSPRNNMVYINARVTADGAVVSGFGQNDPPELGGDRGTVCHGGQSLCVGSFSEERLLRELMLGAYVRLRRLFRVCGSWAVGQFGGGRRSGRSSSVSASAHAEAATRAVTSLQ